MVICNNCGKEITTFTRVCTGIIEDFWRYDKETRSYHFVETKDTSADCVEQILCHNCNRPIGFTTMENIFDSMY